ncbi:MAG: hypothetical protein KDI01_06520 [Halioglobus sp.]|nr:hypothetical protein [Halioglobus sp.]
MKTYLRCLSVIYGLGALLHLIQFLNIPITGRELMYAQMPPTVRAMVKVFLFLDSGTAVGLWLSKRWGVTFFLMAAFGHVILYTAFSALYGGGLGMAAIHALAITDYLFFWFRSGRPYPEG